ncbi:cation transporter [Streptomyces sp. NPDC091371]|uniref:cation diffusion facilitator family transporter n=1 Tax=Streptomyces sp. NPDC091371 TaxID=3155303 RepID=UPI0034237289
MTSEAGAEAESESVGTVIVAALTNLGIAAAKAFGGIVSGSSAMLSEAAHSVADTVTEVLLLTSLKRSAKPADEAHPLGYGPERYIWALLASIATFVGGAVFAMYDGIHTLVHGEGAQLTGSGAYDGVASLLIELLLVWVAWELGRSNAQYLIGRPLPAPMRGEVREVLLGVPHVAAVLELTTLVQGPAEVLIAAKVDFHDLATAGQVEAACEDAESRLRDRFPAIRRVYLDPTPAP